jgi:hypothetical protein
VVTCTVGQSAAVKSRAEAGATETKESDETIKAKDSTLVKEWRKLRLKVAYFADLPIVSPSGYIDGHPFIDLALSE